MLKVTEVVSEILQSSPVAFEAMRDGILNLSAYAVRIHSQVEEKTYKSVKKTTIVVALSRMAKGIQAVPSLRPNVFFDELSIKSPLVDITFDKTKVSSGLLRSLPQIISQANFLTFTEGISEVTVIASEEVKEKILNHFQAAP